MAFILFEETTYFHLCALCACGRDGLRAYFAHTILTRTTRVFLIFVTSAQLINREFLTFPSVNFFKKSPHFLTVAVPLYRPFFGKICKS